MVGRCARGLLTAAVICLVVGVAAGKLLLHLGLSPVLTASMQPSFAPGDAVITRPIPVSQLKPGMVAVFVPPGHQEAYAHRVISISGKANHPVLVTKGDANPTVDHWHATLSGPTVPRVVASVPKAGYALAWLRDPRWRASVIAALGLLMTTVLTRSVLRSRPSPAAVRPSQLSPIS
jgi:signal peptidase